MSEKLTFEKANEKLEKLVQKMESGELSLEESMKTYEEAFNLLSFCYKQRDDCKGQIVSINTRLEEINKKEELFND